MLDFKSVLKPENSVIAGIATMGLVFGIYQMKVGPVSAVHMSPANESNIQASLKKAGWASVIAVAGIALITRDANIAILGGGTIVGEELFYRHAMMASPQTGQIVVTPQSYQQAGQDYLPAQQQTNYAQ